MPARKTQVRDLPRGITERDGVFIASAAHAGKRKQARCKTLDEALIKRRELQAELKGQPIVTSPRPTVANKAWSLKKAVDITTQVAWKGTAYEVNAVRCASACVRYFGAERTLDTVGTLELDEWVAALEAAGKSNATINRHLSAVSKLFSVAQPRGGVQGRPTIPRRPEGGGRIRWLTDQEEAAVLETLRLWSLEHEAMAVEVLLDTGLRCGELLRLTTQDVNFATGMVAVWVTKNRTPRSLPMTDRVRGDLEALVGQTTAGTARLFPWTPWHLSYVWNRVRAHLGLSGDQQFVLHALRHTFGSRLVQRGVDIRTVQQLMGHKTITVTMRYAHLAPSHLADAVAVLNAARESASR